MNNCATPKIDFTNQLEAARVLPQLPLIASHHAGWKGLTFTHYCHPPHETMEHCLLQHALVITAPNSSFQAERRLDGKLKYYAHGNGRIDLIPAFLKRRTSWHQEVEFSVITICPTLLNQAAQDLMPGGFELIPQIAIIDHLIQQLAIALKLEIQTGCFSGRLYGDSLGIALTARLLQNYGVSKPLVSLEHKTYGLPQSQLTQIIEYMRVNLARNVSISDLASLSGISESHFSRSFKRSVGISPYRYLIQQRVEHAKQLLKQKETSISTIALECICKSNSSNQGLPPDDWGYT